MSREGVGVDGTSTSVVARLDGGRWSRRGPCQYSSPHPPPASRSRVPPSPFLDTPSASSSAAHAHHELGAMIIFSAQSPPWYSFLFLLASSHVARAALPLVDFDRMGKVGLAGAFAGLDLFDNSSTSVAFDSSTSTLLSRSADGALSRLGSTNSGGKIEAGCALGNTYYFAGSFSSIGDVSASNLASYDPSSASFSALGSNGPNGDVHSLFCDEANSKVWAGGQFTSPSPSVAVWDTKASSWSAPPFGGLSGAAAEVRSITTNSSASSLFFSGSFLTSFQGSSLNTTNNPNVPFSSGATPFSSSLVPVPLQNAEVEGAPSSTNSQFSDIKSILCPSGSDGPGNTWLAADGNSAQITVRTFQSTSATGIRLGNTFLNGQGTTGFRSDHQSSPPSCKSLKIFFTLKCDFYPR